MRSGCGFGQCDFIVNLSSSVHTSEADTHGIVLVEWLGGWIVMSFSYTDC